MVKLIFLKALFYLFYALYWIKSMPGILWLKFRIWYYGGTD